MAIEQPEQHTSTQPAYAHSPSKASRNLPEGPSTVVPHLIAKYEARNLNNIPGPAISITQTTSTIVPKLGVVDKQKQSPSVGLPSTLPRNNSNQLSQPLIHNTGDVDRAYTSDTAPSGPPFAARAIPPQTQLSADLKHGANYGRGMYAQTHLTLPEPISYARGGSSASTPVATPPAGPSLRDILSDPKPSSASTSLGRSTDHLGFPEEATEARLRVDSHPKPPVLRPEDFRPARSHSSLSLRQPSLRDMSNRATFERGPVYSTTPKKTEHSRSNAPSNASHSHNPTRGLTYERDVNVSSGDVGNIQRHSPERLIASVRASPQQLPGSTTGDSKVENEYPRYLESHRLPPSKSTLTYPGSGSRHEGKDIVHHTRPHVTRQTSTQNMTEQTLVPTTHLTAPDKGNYGIPAQTYRPPIQHSALAEVLSSPTPITKSMSHTIDVQRLKPSSSPSKNSHDQLVGKLHPQTPSPGSLTPSLTPKSRESPPTYSGVQPVGSSQLFYDTPVAPTISNQSYHAASRHHPSSAPREGSRHTNLHMSQPRTSTRVPETSKPPPIAQIPSTTANSHQPQTPITTMPVLDTGNSEIAGPSTVLQPQARTSTFGISAATSSRGYAGQTQKINPSAAIRASATHPPSTSIDRPQPARRYDVTSQRPSSRNRGTASVQLPNHTPLDLIPPRSITVPSPSQPPPTRHDQPIPQSSIPVQTHAHDSTTIPSHPPQISETRPPSEVSILKTPSSLAPSMLKPTVSRTSIPASTVSQESRKRGLFSMFKSKPQPPSQAYEVWHPPSATQKIDRKLNRSKAESPKNSATEADPRIATPLKARDPVPAPIPIASGRKSPNSKVFTPFRYLTSRRNRTMSAASVEAQDGTAVRISYIHRGTHSHYEYLAKYCGRVSNGLYA